MPTRTHRRHRTYDALLDAALKLTASGRGFASLSLREVAREAGVVPTAFYRHFEDMDELGLALVEQSAAALRQLMREARTAPLSTDHITHNSVTTFFDFVAGHRPLFLFLVRERTGGSAQVREALEVTMRLFIADLATDLARMPPLKNFPTADLQVLADLLTNTVFTAVPELLQTTRADKQQALRQRVETQLQIINLGAGQWHGRAAPLAAQALPGTAGAA